MKNINTHQPGTMYHRSHRLALLFLVTATLAVAEFGTQPDGSVTEPLASQTSATSFAFKALGGMPAIAELETFFIIASGQRSFSNEGFSVDDSPLFTATFETTMQHNVDAGSARINYHLETVFPWPTAWSNVRDFSEIVVGKDGYIDGVDNVIGLPSRPMLSDRWAATTKLQRLLNPHLILRDLLDQGGTASFGGYTFIDGQRHVRVVVDDAIHPLALLIRANGGELSRLVTFENDHLTRNTRLEVVYDDWQTQVSGVRFPFSVTVSLNGGVVHSETRSAVVVNEPIDPVLFDIPVGAAPVFDPALAYRGMCAHQFHEQFVTAALPVDGIQDTVVPVELAPGVHWLTGGTHHSLAIEQERGIIIAETPLYPERSEAIINWVESHYPGRPITHVISRHHHGDHSAGLRTFVAIGTKIIIIGAPSVRFFRHEVFRARSTIIPDRLAERWRRGRIRRVRVGGSRHLDDPERPIDIYHVSTSHADDMVVTYLPKQKLLLTSDLFNPGFLNNLQWVTELHSEIVALDLDIETLVGVHGATATWAEFEALASSE